jgi:hypothetical protein
MNCQRKECGEGEIKVQNTEDLCCWHCTLCGKFQYKFSEFECMMCDEGFISDGANRTGCDPIPETYIRDGNLAASIRNYG